MSRVSFPDFVDFERLLVQSGLFDAEWYRRRYPDVDQTGLDPLVHFVRFGARLRRNPGPEFDAEFYARSNSDVVVGGGDPLCHFLRSGRAEGRAAKPVDVSASALDEVPAAPAASTPRLLGHLDRATATLVEGWAVDEARLGAAVRLQLFVDGEKVMDFATSQPRYDVEARGLPGQRAGFALHLEPGVLRKGQVLEVRELSRNQALAGGPKTLEAAHVLAPAPLSTYLPAVREASIRPVSVVVPVYNSPAAVEACLASLHATPMPDDSEVVMLDDGSSDPRIDELLQRYARIAGFRHERNPENIGYTRTVNRALQLCAGRDVVLLNSDTSVTPRWLHNMRYCAYSQPDIGSVTAFSDNSGAFSVPEIGTANPPPPHLDAAGMALTIVQAGTGLPIDVPTGNGFCFYLRRDAIDVVGGFDEARYPRGYGEENDLCMRLLYAGWRNVVCDKAYVFHLRSQSFGENKKELISAGAAQLAIDYPEYRTLIARFGDVDFSMRRNRLRRALDDAAKNPPRPRVLFVISTATGGTPQTNLDLMRAVSDRYDGFLLRCDSLTLTLSRLVDGALVVLETRALHFRLRPMPHVSDEYDRLVLDMLYRYSIDLLHIRHVAWHSLGIAAAAKAIGVRSIFSVHDFYTLCPSVNLLDIDHRYVGVSDEGERLNPLWPQYRAPDGFVRRWRTMMKRFLEDCDQFVTTAPSAMDIFAKVYPDEAKRMRVIPHGRDFDRLQPNAGSVGSRVLKVLIPGNISISKGALLLRDLAGMDRDGKFELHFLGHAIQQVKGVGIHHGAYAREQFLEKVEGISPHIGVVLSIWPETFCHTLTEMWAAGVPVLGLDIGAVGERIRTHGGGWLLPPDSTAEDVHNKLEELLANPAEIMERRREIVEWQRDTASVHDTAYMASQYRQLYSEVLHPEEARPVRVGLVMKLRGRKHRPPTAHIRLLRPLRAAARGGRIDPRPISVDSLIAGGGDAFDVVVIQRDSVPPEQVDALLAALVSAGVPWIFEMDDMLWNLPKDHLDHAIDGPAIAGMRTIAAGAACITTSSEPLARALVETNPRVEIIPNALDESIWCSPLSPELTREVAAAHGLRADRRYMLYMGSNSHAKDLEMIVPAVEEVLRLHPDVQVIQIGGGHPLPFAKELTCPPRFPTYPEFVTWFRMVATYCSLALAPLRADEFNEAKSDIKFLDYSLAGVPTVFSRFGPYQRTVVDGETGLLCDSSKDAWVRAISSLLESEELRGKLGERAGRAAQERTLGRSGIGAMWTEVLQTVGRKDRFG